MAELSTLLDAVLAAPDDNTPRLAYADWCDAQADPDSRSRAALIREQIAHALVTPEQASTPQALRLGMEIRERLNTHQATWSAPVGGLVDAYRFRRGFIGWVRMSAQRFLDDGDRIFASAPVRHVDLTDVRDVDETLWQSPLLSKLSSLSMDGCGLYDLHVQLLADSPQLVNLRWLSVADNNLGLPSAEALARSTRMPSLELAEFRGNPVDPVERLGLDSGFVVSSAMPPEGQDLERRFGPLRWLRRDGDEVRFVP